MDLPQVIGSLITLCVFFGTAFFWLWSRLEAKRAEDRESFRDIYAQLKKLDGQVKWLLGRAGIPYEEIPQTRVV